MSKVCFAFQKGSCTRGRKCKFEHSGGTAKAPSSSGVLSVLDSVEYRNHYSEAQAGVDSHLSSEPGRSVRPRTDAPLPAAEPALGRRVYSLSKTSSQASGSGIGLSVDAESHLEAENFDGSLGEGIFCLV